MSLEPYVHVDEALAGRAAGERVALSPAEHHHVATVLRLRPGAVLRVADGAGAHAPARLADRYVELTAPVAVEPVPEPRLRVVQALPKGRKLDEVVRVLTELGVDAITVLEARHSVSQVDHRRSPRHAERWAAVARAASEQARRCRRPVIEGPVAGVAAFASPPDALLLVADPSGVPLPERLGALGAAVGATAEIVLAVGPEGGWSDDELATWTAAGADLVGLGPTVLRTEHAAAAGVAVLAALLGRWAVRPLP